MTFIDTGDESLSPEGASFVAGFSVLSVAYLVLAYASVRLSSRDRTFYEWNAIRLLFPWVALVMTVESITLAWDAGKGNTVVQGWAVFVYMLQATVAPSLFLSTFVITYIAHRTRSIPFCIVYRGSGKPEYDEEEPIQRLVRPAVLVAINRVFAASLLVFNLIVNLDIIWQNDGDLAGRTGWYTVFSDISIDSVYIGLALVPMTLVAIICIYFGFLLWRYGTEFSMVIYSSFFNPWMVTCVGACLLLGAHCVGPRLFPILTSSSIFVFMGACFLTMLEVQHDVRTANDLGHFLDALGNGPVRGSVINERNNTADVELADTNKFRSQADVSSRMSLDDSSSSLSQEEKAPEEPPTIK